MYSRDFGMMINSIIKGIELVGSRHFLMCPLDCRALVHTVSMFINEVQRFDYHVHVLTFTKNKQIVR